MERAPVVVLGGGVAGLAAAYYLARDGWPVTVVERAAALGGLCGSFQSHGFTLDHGPHKLYSVVPGILDEIRSLLDGRLIEHRKRSRIRLLGRYLDYPLSLGNLLPLLGPWRAARLGLGYAAAVDAPFFYYPRGAFGEFPARLASEVGRLGGRILTSAVPRALERVNGSVRAVHVETGRTTERLPCSTLVSSIPMGSLARLLQP